MKSKDELKEIDIKNRTYYYFDDIIKDVDIYIIILSSYQMKSYMKIFHFMTFHIKLQWV